MPCFVERYQLLKDGKKTPVVRLGSLGNLLENKTNRFVACLETSSFASPEVQ
jgi:hypothetical protein